MWRWCILCLNGVSRGKTEKKNMFFLFFDPGVVSDKLVLQIHLCTYVLCVCAVCYADSEGRDIPTLSRMRYSTEKTPFIERYFFANINSFWLVVSGTRIISFLYLIHMVSTVLRKSKLFPLVRAVLSRNLFHPAAAALCYPCVLLLCVVDFQQEARGWRYLG